MRPTLLFAALALAACGSFRELAPETAAARLAGSDSLRGEACAISQRYADRLAEYAWSDAAPLEPLDRDELAHVQAVFALRPSITCRVKLEKFFYDLDGKALYELALGVSAMEQAYAAIPEGGALADCEACRLEDYSASSGLLVQYFRAPAFAEARARHYARFADLCLDVENAAAHAEAIEQHALHAEPRLNPLFNRHGGCDAVFTAYYKERGGSCTKYGRTKYLVCDTGLWSASPPPPRPVTYFPQGYRKLEPFASGFVLALNDGTFDVYWLEGDDLQHFTTTPAAPPQIADHDGDARTDVRVGDVLVLSQPGGAGRRTTTAEIASARAAAEADRKRRRHEATFALLPLADVERLLGEEYAENPELLDRAADLSLAWYADARDAQRASLELSEALWHATLWNAVTGKHPVGGEYWEALAAKASGAQWGERRRALAEARKRGDAAQVFAECNALRAEAAAVVDELEGAAAGSAAAKASLAHLWERYRGAPMSTAGVEAARDAALRARAELDAFLQATCL